MSVWGQQSGKIRLRLDTTHDINISDLRLVQEVRDECKIEYLEEIHFRKNNQCNLLNADNGNIRSLFLSLIVVERTVDKKVVDLTQDTAIESLDEESFYECEYKMCWYNACPYI